MTEINLPQVVQEVTDAFVDYERALLVNEMETLDDYFWDSEQPKTSTVRRLSPPIGVPVCPSGRAVSCITRW